MKAEYAVGQRVIVGAITPCGQCFYCLNGVHSQCHGGWAAGGSETLSTVPGPNTCWSRMLGRTWRWCLTNSRTRQVLMLPDIASTGISGAENGNVRTGDSCRDLRAGAIGLCATFGCQAPRGRLDHRRSIRQGTPGRWRAEFGALAGDRSDRCATSSTTSSD